MIRRLLPQLTPGSAWDQLCQHQQMMHMAAEHGETALSLAERFAVHAGSGDARHTAHRTTAQHHKQSADAG